MVTQFPDVSQPKSNPGIFTPANLTLPDFVGVGALLVLAVLIAGFVVIVVKELAFAVEITFSVVVPTD